MRRRSPPHQAAVRTTTVGGTDVHDFPELKGAVFQGLNRAADGLQYAHRPCASRAMSFFANGHAYPASSEKLLVQMPL